MYKVSGIFRKGSYSKIFIILPFLFVIVLFSLMLFFRFSERNEYEVFLRKQFREIPDYLDEESNTIPQPDRPDLAAWHEYFKTVDPKLKRVPVERLAKAFEQTKSLILYNKRKSITASTLEWTGYSSDHGGRTRTLMFDPNDPENKKVWAGAVTGGLWYNGDITNPGFSWIPVNDLWDNLAISCITADPNNLQIFYVGTGTFINPAGYDFRLNTLFANGMNVQENFIDQLVVINDIPYNPTGYFVDLNTGSDVPYSYIHVSRYSPQESSGIFWGDRPIVPTFRPPDPLPEDQ